MILVARRRPGRRRAVRARWPATPSAQLRIPFGDVVLPAARCFGLTLPFEVVVVPLYYQMQTIGLLNTRLGLILPLIGLNMPFAVFWMRTHFQSVPSGAHRGVHRSTAPARGRRSATSRSRWPSRRIASLAVLLFLGTWNQFLLAIVLIDDPTKRTMAGALQNFVGAHSTDVVLLNAGALLIMAPTIVVFLIFQRYFVQAMLAGAVKG